MITSFTPSDLLINIVITLCIGLASVIVGIQVIVRQNGQRLWKLPILFWLLCWFAVRLFVIIVHQCSSNIDVHLVNNLITAVGIQGALSIAFKELLQTIDIIRRNPSRIEFLKEWIIQTWARILS